MFKPSTHYTLTELQSDVFTVLSVKLQAKFQELELNIRALTHSIPEHTQYFSEIERLVKEQAEVVGMLEYLEQRLARTVDLDENKEQNNG